MSKSSITRSITVLFALIASVALVSADLIISAQNTNSSTTQEEPTRGGMITTQNGNTSNTGRRRRGRRRGTPRTNTNTSGDMTDNTNMADDTQNANMGGEAAANTSGDMPMTGGGRRRRRGRRRSSTATAGDTSGQMTTGSTDAADGGVQEDLAGKSYTGTANYADGGVTGPATLAFESGNQFTLTPEGGTAMSGRYTAVTTRGYTGVTMMFSNATPPTIVSVRLKKAGRGVSIMSVPGETRQFSFTSSGGSMASGGGGRRRRRGGKRRGGTRGGIKPPMSAPSEPTNP